MALFTHQPEAGIPELQAGRRVDCIVDAAVTGHEAAEELGIGGVDDGIDRKPGDIPLPEDQPEIRWDGGQRIAIDDPLLLPFRRQKGVLYRQKVGRQGPRRADIHQRAEQPPLGDIVVREGLCLLPILGHLLQEEAV